MRLKLLLTIICAAILVACGSGKFNLKTEFPESLGKYKLQKSADEKDEGYKAYYKTGGEGEYEFWTREYKSDNVMFTLKITKHKEKALADNELREILKECKDEDIKKGTKIMWKEAALNDKSGKEVGKIRICRYKYGSTSSTDWGRMEYYIGFSASGKTYTPEFITMKTGNIVEFIKALPVSANLDLSVLDELMATNPDKGLSITELEKLSPPVQTAENPYLKGKIYEISAESNKFIDVEQRAFSAGEIGSILKVDCRRSFQIGNYNAGGQMIPAYAKACKVTIIDYTIPAVIAEKDFINSKIPTSMTFSTTDGKVDSGKQVDAETPWGEIKTYLDNLPKT